jgi:hypothetical protein
MLLAAAILSSSKLKRRIAAFFFSFSVWDLAYYPTLHTWLGWPASIWDLNVYFLIPVPWAGPVLTPIVASPIIGLLSAWMLLRTDQQLNVLLMEDPNAASSVPSLFQATALKKTRSLL